MPEYNMLQRNFHLERSSHFKCWSARIAWSVTILASSQKGKGSCGVISGWLEYFGTQQSIHLLSWNCKIVYFPHLKALTPLTRLFYALCHLASESTEKLKKNIWCTLVYSDGEYLNVFFHVRQNVCMFYQKDNAFGAYLCRRSSEDVFNLNLDFDPF